MRYLLAFLMIFGVTAYAQEVSDVPAEVTVNDDDENAEVAVALPADSHEGKKGCGCGGKPK